jgi:hypothetical protein
MIKEDESYPLPLLLFFEYYDNEIDLKNKITSR